MTPEYLEYMKKTGHGKHKKIIKTVKSISHSNDLLTAFNEWECHWDRLIYDELSPCEFCGEKRTKHRFGVTNKITGEVRMVGNQCLYKFSINRLNGRLLSEEEAKTRFNSKVKEVKKKKRLRSAPKPEPEPEPAGVSCPFYILLGYISCPSCGKETTVYGFAGVKKQKICALPFISSIPSYLESIFIKRRIKKHQNYLFKNQSYYMNHCEHCHRPITDGIIYSQEGAFFYISKDKLEQYIHVGFAHCIQKKGFIYIEQTHT